MQEGSIDWNGYLHRFPTEELILAAIKDEDICDEWFGTWDDIINLRETKVINT